MADVFELMGKVKHKQEDLRKLNDRLSVVLSTKELLESRAKTGEFGSFEFFLKGTQTSSTRIDGRLNDTHYREDLRPVVDALISVYRDRAKSLMAMIEEAQGSLNIVLNDLRRHFMSD